MARVSIKSICDELMPEYKTLAFITKRIAKKLDKEVTEPQLRAQANRLVREGALDHAKAAKKYGIRGPKAEEAATATPKRKAKAAKPAKTEKTKSKAKAAKPAKTATKKKSEKVSKTASKASGKKDAKGKAKKTLRRTKK